MIEVTSKEMFERKVLNSDAVVVVDFYTPSCGPCKALKPKLAKLEAEENVWVYTVNCEEQSDLAAEYNVSGVPTIIVFERGFVLNQHTGSINDYTQLVNLVG